MTDDIKKQAQAILNNPARHKAKPGQDELTASDDVNDPKHQKKVSQDKGWTQDADGVWHHPEHGG